MKRTITFIFLALSINAIAGIPPYVPTSGLVAWYPFTGNANDSSGNGHNGTTAGGVSLTSDRFGNLNSAYLFNGLSGYISVPAAPALEFTTAFTLSVWINQNFVASGGFRILDKETSASLDGYLFDTYGDPNDTTGRGRRGRMTGDGTNWFAENTAYPLNTWHHLVCTYNAGAIKYYLDGVADGSFNDGTTALNTNNLTLQIGASHPLATVAYFSGAIDDIGLWNRALTQAEITNLFLACSNIFITQQPQNTTLNAGSTAQFIIASSGTTVQWQQDAGTGFTNLSNAGQYSGVNTDTLTIGNVSLAMNHYHYRCVATYGGCADTSNYAILTVHGVGIDEISDNLRVSISPNPMTYSSILQLNIELKNAEVVIYDVVGREILRKKLAGDRMVIERKILVSGIYFVKVSSEEKQWVEKIVVE